jgi:hypothetical protein
VKKLSLAVLSVFLSASVLRPAVRAEIAIGGATPPADTGSSVAAGDDTGTSVVKFEKPAEEENKWMPWILGIGSAVVALVGGFLIADSNSSDAEDAAAAADASNAAAAAANAAAAAAQTAAVSNQTAAALAAAASADAALAAATDPTGPFNTRLFIAGTFIGDPQPSNSPCGNFSPSLTFSISQAGNFPGGITGLTSSADCASAASGGNWEQVNDFEILIRVNDGFYIGRARVRGTTEIILANGAVLRAGPGAAINVFKKGG